MLNFLEAMNIPKDCEVDRNIPKTTFYKHDMKSADRIIFTNNIERIRLKCMLNQNNLNIKEYVDKEKQYYECVIIEINLKKRDEYERISELVNKSIKSPIVIIFEHNDKILINVALKNESKNDLEAVTIKDNRYTDWIDDDLPNQYAQRLFENMDITKLNHTNFYNFFKSIFDNIVRYNGSRFAQKELTMPANEIKDINEEIYYLLKDIQELKKLKAKETQIKNKIKLNTELQQKKKEVKTLMAQLY